MKLVFVKLTEKHMCLSLIFLKLKVCWAATLSKKRLQHRYFPVNFATFLTAPPYCYNLRLQIIEFLFLSSYFPSIYYFVLLLAHVFALLI